ncbi:threonine/serine exporter family protein [Schnuerera sp. xch1]|uniref:threonine/serine exporter family protein n=1 Tax=Schnuerera sp. xch1 TaxID=2874283 RepID=UPI001CBE64BD|nr:threonine/serine exporter family protein [Schnuerera sp. xch1]MBZ2173958.1 threonine/serine exporter family protein [Schnuerera sp. xch1]
MEIIKNFLFSFLSTVGFNIIFSAPKGLVLKSGFVGGIGWIVLYSTSIYFNSSIISTFFAALTVGILGELFSRHYKKPATVFIIPGIIPLVPGAGMYYTMLALVEKDFLAAADKGTETLFIAAAISIGLIVSTTLSRSIKRVKYKR